MSRNQLFVQLIEAMESPDQNPSILSYLDTVYHRVIIHETLYLNIHFYNIKCLKDLESTLKYMQLKNIESQI